MNKDDIVERIAAGTATLLGIEDICKRLGVSRTTFDRWVRNGSERISSSTRSSRILGKLDTTKVSTYVPENVAEGNISFPPPDIRIGNSPKWEMETFKAWLRENINK